MLGDTVIRQAISSDIPKLIKMDHGVNTDHVWQLSLQKSAEEISASFPGCAAAAADASAVPS